MPEVERLRVREDMTKVKLARDIGTHPYVIWCWFNGTAIGRDDRCSFSSMLTMPRPIACSYIPSAYQLLCLGSALMQGQNYQPAAEDYGCSQAQKYDEF